MINIQESLISDTFKFDKDARQWFDKFIESLIKLLMKYDINEMTKINEISDDFIHKEIIAAGLFYKKRKIQKYPYIFDNSLDQTKFLTEVVYYILDLLLGTPLVYEVEYDENGKEMEHITIITKKMLFKNIRNMPSVYSLVMDIKKIECEQVNNCPQINQ